MLKDHSKKIELLDKMLAVGGFLALVMLLARYGIPRFTLPQTVLAAWAAIFPIGLFLEAFYRLIWIKDPWQYLKRHPFRYLILLMLLLELSGVATWSYAYAQKGGSTALVVGELYVTIAMLAFVGNWIKGGLAANRWLAERRIPILLIPTLSFSLAIAAGTLVLGLPGFHRTATAGIDILFTVTSAICVTGLTTVDIAATFTAPGHFLVALLIQLGGLGTMTTLGMLALWHGGKLTLEESVIFRELVGGQHLRQTKGLLKTIAIVTISVELSGALVLGFLWREHVPHAMLQGAFHAVSAFCNAGFSLFQDNLVAFRQDRMTQLVFMVLIVIGGLGFTVVADLFQTGTSRVLPWVQARPLKNATKLVLYSSAVLIVFGMVVFWLDGVLYHQPRTIFSSLFQSVACRTAGFQVESQLHFGLMGLVAALILMTIGASPQSTGGGIRTTVLARLFARIDPQDAGQPKSLLAFKPFRIALFCVTCYLAIAIVGSIVLMVLDSLAWNDAFFEAFSALGTVGLSRDITPSLSTPAKWCLIVLMFAGRVIFPTLVIHMIRSRRTSRDQVEWV